MQEYIDAYLETLPDVPLRHMPPIEELCLLVNYSKTKRFTSDEDFEDWLETEQYLHAEDTRFIERMRELVSLPKKPNEHLTLNMGKRKYSVDMSR